MERCKQDTFAVELKCVHLGKAYKKLNISSVPDGDGNKALALTV